MRLRKIKLSGFKSFVDPIVIPVTGNLIGVVGPNGCGKSNIIDAVRWVMGELSAKHLRGDSMADVIFSGSSARKPVGKAAVELVFDNSEGRAPGQYAGFAEISIRREASRDGQSDYFLNKTRCRRKDITDIFLGTGLGPRAYSIIEQGSVTRIVEAKPEDLRFMLEEAAGVSRYRERRRETETRIRHTRENLARVEDIRKELGSQLDRLQRQSRAAQRYKDMKQQERALRAQLLALRWNAIAAALETHEASVRERDTALEAALAALRAAEAEIESTRTAHFEQGERVNAVQAELYQVGSEITTAEQAIEHSRATRQQLEREHDQLEAGRREALAHLEADRGRLQELEGQLAATAPRLEAQRAERAERTATLRSAETAMHDWQLGWEEFTRSAGEAAGAIESQAARVEVLGSQHEQFRERDGRLAAEAAAIADELQVAASEELRREVAARAEHYANLEQGLEQIEAGIRQARALFQESQTAIDAVRIEKQNAEASLAGLNALQAAALGQYDEALGHWLAAQGLDRSGRLAGAIQVEAGWEKAVERVLGAELAAVCVDSIDRHAASLGAIPPAELSLLERHPPGPSAPAAHATLLDKIRTELDLSAVLAGVYVAESIEEALARRAGLAAHESIVTREGVRIGRNWLAVADEDSRRAGMLGREREIEGLRTRVTDLDTRLSTGQTRLADIQGRLQALEQEREQRQRELGEHGRERAEIHERLGHAEARHSQIAARLEQIRGERAEITTRLARLAAERESLDAVLAAARAAAAQQEQRRAALLASREDLGRQLEGARVAAEQSYEALHRIEMEREGHHTTAESTRQGISRLEQQLAQVEVRRVELEALLARDREPESAIRQRLQDMLERRNAVEARLAQERQGLGTFDSRLRELEPQRHRHEQAVQAARGALEQERMARQELIVRREAVEDQAREAGEDLEAVRTGLPPEATAESWQQRLEEIGAKIERLGAINLVAIEEFEEQSQRKAYLDSQSQDLSQALATLEEAIRKIDRETRTRFRETFDRVNAEFQALFPRLFGGGHAYLELTGDDLLESGVTVMARPPGKRNSTIHLLSGGEKALTAVALLFSIFELNPAPFCFLDEVDAPLDDANVNRYCEMLKALSQKTQLVYITHNKISMETAEVLVGVTMSEPGVSRLVAVDVDQALEMVAQ